VQGEDLGMASEGVAEILINPGKAAEGNAQGERTVDAAGQKSAESGSLGVKGGRELFGKPGRACRLRVRLLVQASTRAAARAAGAGQSAGPGGQPR
jgi:hypothetical protein